MAVALKEKAPTDPAALKNWRADEQAKERSKRDKEKSELGTLWSRRDFLGVLGWAGFGAFSLIGLLAAVRSAFPRVLFLPPSKFKAGLPDDYVVGEVSEKFKQDFRTWIIRTKAGFYAIFAKCTHLGCTPRWLKTEQKFKCPCHGSGYYISGLNFEGPAPRPMDRFKIYVGDDGQLVVDKSVVYTMEPGVDPNEQFPDSILKIA
jgi:cytochrome b6-f complex iron-sulfur subunit